MSTKILIKGGTVVNAEGQCAADVLVEGDKIVSVGPSLSADGVDKVIDATGKFVMPGGIDSHVHLGLEFMGAVAVDEQNYGTRAGAAGGTTMCMDFIIPARGQSLVEATLAWKAKMPLANTDLAAHCAVIEWNDRVSEEMGVLVRDHGVTSFKMFLAYRGVFMLTDEELYAAFSRCKELGAVAQVHAENGDLVYAGQQRMLRMGITGPEGHLMSRPEYVEVEATERAIAIARMVNTPLYVVHVMSPGSADAIARARAQGARVFGEPIAAGLGTDGKPVFNSDFTWAAAHVMGPPLRADSTVRDKLMGHLAAGNLQVTGTDNCTFNPSQKANGRHDFTKIPNGVNGIEDRLKIVWSNGVAKGVLTPPQFVAATSANAAKIFGCYPRKGLIAAGSDADIVVWDGDRKTTISAKTHHHAVEVNIFEGMEVTGYPEVTISAGRVVWEDGKLNVEQGKGRYVPRRAFAAAFDGIEFADRAKDERQFKVTREGDK